MAGLCKDGNEPSGSLKAIYPKVLHDAGWAPVPYTDRNFMRKYLPPMRSRTSAHSVTPTTEDSEMDIVHCKVDKSDVALIGYWSARDCRKTHKYYWPISSVRTEKIYGEILLDASKSRAKTVKVVLTSESTLRVGLVGTVRIALAFYIQRYGFDPGQKGGCFTNCATCTGNTFRLSYVYKHRIGVKSVDASTECVHSFPGTKEMIMNRVKNARGTKLRFVNDLSYERRRRKLLLPYLKTARSKGHFAIMIDDKLKINDKVYVLEYCEKNCDKPEF
ncbi:hypothetical protein ANN_01148 [Periplaneta americana]|uniref:Uncharacterized protein n=1 Tax=Periplaneta americana TaxID=6978 RepID=A0ABQ8TSW4_PERAM|nr:hypothetical protein ANN_01148 [Periplaneta americana]